MLYRNSMLASRMSGSGKQSWKFFHKRKKKWENMRVMTASTWR